MTLAQVQAAIALVVALIGTWAGLLIAIALLFPGPTERAERSLALHPWPCLGVGLGIVLAPGLLGAVLLQAPNPGAKLIGVLVLVLPAVAITIGSAGVARLLGRRAAEMSGAHDTHDTHGTFGGLVRGSLVYALAAFFPIIGWYLFSPIASLCAAGAGLMALLPERRPAPPVVASAPPGPAQA